MSDPNHSMNSDRSDEFSALFSQMVLQQANMAMLLMGKIARPDTGEITKDLQAAKYFVDLLEMLEAKTKGNLSKEESNLLKQTLMSCRLTYVEAVEEPDTGKTATSEPVKANEDKTPPPEAGVEPATSTEASADEESKKKFSKKY